MVTKTIIPTDITTLKQDVSTAKTDISKLKEDVSNISSKNVFNEKVEVEKVVSPPTSGQTNNGPNLISTIKRNTGSIETQVKYGSRAKYGYPSHAVIGIKYSNSSGVVEWLVGSDGHFYFPGPDGYIHSGNMNIHWNQDSNSFIFENTSTIDVWHIDKSFAFQCAGTSVSNGRIHLWGNGGDRKDVIEFGTSEGYLFYAERNASGDRNLTLNNGAINCRVVNQSSDRDLKDNITPIKNATDKVRKINGCTYTFKSNGMPYAGVIAQEIMEVLPEAIGSTTVYPDDSSGIDGSEGQRFFTVDYSAVVALLVQTCKESDDRITKLESEVQELKTIVKTLLTNNDTSSTDLP